MFLRLVVAWIRMARVPLPSQADLPSEYRYLLDEDVLGERNIFRAIGNNPPVLQSFMRYGATLWNDAGLSPRQRELVILAVARACRSRYEWQQHVELAQEQDITLEEIDAIGETNHQPFADDERSLLTFASAMASNGVSDATHQALARHYNDREITAVIMLVSHYIGIARAIAAFDLPIENAFVGWTPSTNSG